MIVEHIDFSDMILFYFYNYRSNTEYSPKASDPTMHVRLTAYNYIHKHSNQTIGHSSTRTSRAQNTLVVQFFPHAQITARTCPVRRYAFRAAACICDADCMPHSLSSAISVSLALLFAYSVCMHSALCSCGFGSTNKQNAARARFTRTAK